MGREEAPPGSRVRSHFEKIANQAERAAGLTRQLLAFARRQVLQPRSLSLNQSVTDVTNLLQKVIGEQIELKLSLAPDLPVVRADPAQLEQVLMNLCLNARDAMPEGGQLTVETGTAEFDDEYCRRNLFARPGRYVLVTVTDTGVGMSPETLEHIFEPFFSTKEPGHGTGLGLATVYGIVQQHEGLIHVYSEPGYGSTFRVYLPIVAAATEPCRPAASEPVRGGSETILVAEDHEGGRQMVCEILTRLGYTVLAAANGEEAVRLFQQHRDQVALLLFDVVMPQLSGPDAFREIEAIRPGVPVIFATGYSAKADLPSSLAEEHRHLIQKPYSPTALARKIREVLDACAEKTLEN
jgi:CheY-like chemotaxis protein